MKKIPLLLLFICSLHVSAQVDSVNAIKEINAFQQHLNEEYRNRETSPLDEKQFSEFNGHDFFPIDLDYRVNAKLTATEGTPFFAMKTTSSVTSTERIYGYINFTLSGKEFRLPVYQSKSLMITKEYADYLFFPFTDATNGEQTYSGGRYIDLRIPKEGNDVIVDFNMAYNPYCAYSAKYSCPIVPVENQMDVEVSVGVGYLKKKGNETEVFTRVEIAPEYPGGYEAMVRFIGKNMKYPKAAYKQKLEGTVYVQFLVLTDGKISDITTLKGISAECDLEAQRVISIMPKWKPGKLNGENVAVRFVMPIKYKGPASWKKG